MSQDWRARLAKVVDLCIFLPMAGAVVLLWAILRFGFRVQSAEGVVTVLVVGILLNGFIATLEDDLPGGFNNPDGSDTPTYVRRLQRLFGVVGPLSAMVIGIVGVTAIPDWGTVILFGGLSLSLLVFSLPKAWPHRFGWPSWWAGFTIAFSLCGAYLLP
jgi:hypothetical protein